MAIAVGQMDRKVELYVRSQIVDTAYGGITDIEYNVSTEEIWAHVIWRGGKVSEQGEQMQDNELVEFYVRNGGVMKTADVEDFILYDSKKYYIDVINVVDGREKYLQIITTKVEV